MTVTFCHFLQPTIKQLNDESLYMSSKTVWLDLLNEEREKVNSILKPKIVKAQRLSAEQVVMLESINLLKKRCNTEESFMTFIR